MDDDVLRRGKPTCHVAFGEATALLAGDALQASRSQRSCRRAVAAMPAQRLRAARATPRASRGMAGGQAIDLVAVGKPMTLPELEPMHRMKTGALIRASMLLGARAGAALERTARKRALDAFARAAGLAFQVVDDVLDVEGSGDDARQDRGQGRRAEQADLRDAARARRGEAARARSCARRRSPRSRRSAHAARRLRRARRLDHAADALTMYSHLLERIDSPADLRKLDARAQLRDLARELRAFLLDSVAQTGGHLSSNLGTVELTIALHYVFDTPQRPASCGTSATRPTRTRCSPAGARRWRKLRLWDGPSGFPRRSEARIRHVRHRALVDVDLRRARHGGRARSSRARSGTSSR